MDIDAIAKTDKFANNNGKDLKLDKELLASNNTKNKEQDSRLNCFLIISRKGELDLNDLNCHDL